MTVSTGAIDAVIVNEGGSISAVSGICTHLGCRLQPDDAGKKLDCPCHQTAFGWTAKVLYYRLKAEPANLPKIPSRVNGAQLQMLVVFSHRTHPLGPGSGRRAPPVAWNAVAPVVLRGLPVGGSERDPSADACRCCQAIAGWRRIFRTYCRLAARTGHGAVRPDRGHDARAHWQQPPGRRSGQPYTDSSR